MLSVSDRSTDPRETLVLLPVCVLQPFHEFGVAQEVSVEGAVFGQGELSCVLRKGGALVMALNGGVTQDNWQNIQKEIKYKPHITLHPIFL